MDGLLVIDKPAGITSHDVVNRVRRLTGERSVGHLGTLDPIATGVLPLLLGRWTRLAQFYNGAEKAYEGEIRFGFATDTYDAAGEPLGQPQAVALELEPVRRLAAEFRGLIQQTPPAYSSKKVAGVAAYKLARRRQALALKPVQVEVREFEILAIAGDRARFKARVAAGTYLRSVAHELGQRLEVGAHLAGLRRTAVAELTLEQAHPLAELEGGGEPTSDNRYSVKSRVETYLLSPRAVLPQFPGVHAPEDALPRFLHGNAVNLPEFSQAPWVKVFRSQAELVGVARRVAGSLFQPKVVLAAAADTAASNH